jgi:hypothetical protein
VGVDGREGLGVWGGDANRYPFETNWRDPKGIMNRWKDERALALESIALTDHNSTTPTHKKWCTRRVNYKIKVIGKERKEGRGYEKKVEKVPIRRF